MTFELTKRHRDALKSLHEECIYSDQKNAPELRFIAEGKLKGGDKTFKDLVTWDLAIVAPRSANGNKGYRITVEGVAALRAQTLPKPKPPRRSAAKLEPLLSSLSDRIELLK